MWGNFPPDIRVEKEANTLLKEGHEVFLLALKRNPKEREHEVYRGIKINRIPKPPLYEIFYGSFFNLIPSAKKQIEVFIEENDIDVIHVHDLFLVNTTYFASKKFKIPIIADLHEPYPELIKLWHGNRIERFIFYDYRRWLFFENHTLHKVNKIITVAEEAKRRLILIHGIHEKKIEVITNTETLEFCNLSVNRGIVKAYTKYFTILYVGGFGSHRGIETLLQATSKLRDTIPNLRVVIVGGRDNQIRKTEERSRNLGIADIVEFTGYKPFKEVPSYLHAASLCVVPHTLTSHTDNTIPHKLFQYMLLGKPVIVSSCKPLREIIEMTKGGLVFTANNPNDLAAKIEYLYKNKKLLKKLGRFGLRATRYGKWNWENTSKRLISIYKNLW
ncbi:glycosyltransferase family 4 protein [Thermococcus sp. MV5]|uniref:glycosyltransferase family 4 protein n=1 Tax=Thermococcus sp. MV5 TaxID=1638272 RepID=UPI001438716F|nr:glycosyltransferase family 4 protein [Thermococcus sp. MV5]